MRVAIQQGGNIDKSLIQGVAIFKRHNLGGVYVFRQQTQYCNVELQFHCYPFIQQNIYFV